MEFSEVIKDLSKAVLEVNAADVNAVLVSRIKSYGLSAKDEEMIVRAMSLIDKTVFKNRELQAAKQDGVGRDEFIAQQMDSILSKRTEQEGEAILEAVENVINR